MAKLTDDLTFHYKHNRLQQLRGFCHTVDFNSVSRAAKHMGLGQSSVSLQIKALEEDLGCQLFLRNGPRVSLTADGKKLYELAKPLVDGIQNLRQEFHSANRAREAQTLIVAANQTARDYILPDVLKEYLRHSPDMRFIIHTVEHHEALLLLLKSKDVDIAVLPKRGHLTLPSMFEHLPTHHFPACLITPASHPLAGKADVSVEEILQYPLTLPAKEMGAVENLYELLFEGRPDVALKVAFENSETGKFYVEAGIAITVSSNVWVREGDALVATPLPHLFKGVDYGVVRVKDKQYTPQVQRFITLMKRLGAASIAAASQNTGRMAGNC